MSPLITSQNMDDAYIIDDLCWGARQWPAAQGQAGSRGQPQSKQGHRVAQTLRQRVQSCLGLYQAGSCLLPCLSLPTCSGIMGHSQEA